MTIDEPEPSEQIRYDLPPVDGPAALVPFIALRLSGADHVAIVPAPRRRDWMSDQFWHSARRCLPLTMANQAGWYLLNPVAFTVEWNGQPSRGGLRIEYDTRPVVRLVEDRFGGGTVSFRVPYLFRTPPGWNTLARGPANHVKDGASALEGLVETDWAVSTFSMNWKITRPDHAVRFDAGEPFCMILPQQCGQLERVRPRVEDIDHYPHTRRRLHWWNSNRRDQLFRTFLQEHGKEPVEDSQPDELQYLRGAYPEGGRPGRHETRMRLHGFG